jgi:glycosyltransferase involved in cell wall biosynthesis
VRILVVANGASIHTRRWVAELEARGHQVAVASDAPDPDRPGTHPLPHLKRWRLNLPLLARRLRFIADDYRPDLVHAHYASHYGLLAAWAGLHPLVVSVWGADVEVFPTRSTVNRGVLRAVLSRAEAVTATSRYLAGVTAPYLPRGRTAHVVPFGVDTALFRPSQAAKAHPPLIVTNKHLEPAYGIDVLLDALTRIQDVAWQVEILGDGGLRQSVAASIFAAGIGARVRLPGRVPPETVAERLGIATVAVYPSRRESFGVATLEASAMGIPVIAARVGGLPEVVEDGVTGTLVDPERADLLAEAIREVVGRPDRARAMGAAGRRLVEERYTWARAVDGMEAVYREVLQGPAVAP